MITKVGHWLGIRNLPSIPAAAFPAMPFLGPQAFFKPPGRRLVIGKHVHHLNKRQSISIGFSSHDTSPFADDFYTGMDF